MFETDPQLLWMTALMASLALVPLAVTPFVPLVDLPDHTAIASLLPGVLRGREPEAHFYRVNLTFMPYWTAYLVMVLSKPILGALGAAKLILGLNVVALPLAFQRLLWALGRSPRLGLAAFALCWDLSAHWGWFSYGTGLALAIYLLARTLEVRTPREALALLPFGLLLGLAHALPSGLCLLAIGVTGLVAGSYRRAGLHALSALGVLLALAPWLLASRQRSAGGPPWGFDFEDPATKLGGFFASTVGNLVDPRASWLAAAVVVLLLFGGAWLAQLPQREPARIQDRQALALVATAMALYGVAPLNVRGPVWHDLTSVRFATIALLFLQLAPRPRLESWKPLIPYLLGAALINLATARQFHAFGQETASFRQIIAAVEPGKAVFPMTLNNNSKHSKLRVLNQMHAYIAAEKGGYDPYLFDYPTQPLLYRNEHRPPVPPWYQPQAFSIETHGKRFDYVLVQGERDPLAGQPGVELLAATGPWRLYRIRKTPAPAH